MERHEIDARAAKADHTDHAAAKMLDECVKHVESKGVPHSPNHRSTSIDTIYKAGEPIASRTTNTIATESTQYIDFKADGKSFEQRNGHIFNRGLYETGKDGDGKQTLVRKLDPSSAEYKKVNAVLESLDFENLPHCKK